MLEKEEKNRREATARAEEDNKKKKERQEIERKIEEKVEERRKEVIRIKLNSYEVTLIAAVQALDTGKKELERLRTSPMVQPETKFGSNFSIVEGKTLRAIEVTMHLMSTLTKNEAEGVQEKARGITVMMAEALSYKGRKPWVIQGNTDTSVCR